MKAVQITRYGGYEVLEIKGNVEIPKVEGKKVLVKIAAASINPFDIKFRSGMYKSSLPVKFPYIPGGDFSGLVHKSANQSKFKVGDEIYGSANILNGGTGSFAEFAIARIAAVAKRPKRIGFLESAALPLAGVSSVQVLEQLMKLNKLERILIHGGAGGIGHLAIQLAKSTGAYVITTVSRDDFEFVRKLGADEAIDYKSEKFEEKLSNLDAVFDTVGGNVTNKSLKVIKKNGVLVSMIGDIDFELAKKLQVKAIRHSTKMNTNDLNRLSELVDSGKINVNIDKIFSLDQAREAFGHQEENHPRGKVVVKIRS